MKRTISLSLCLIMFLVSINSVYADDLKSNGVTNDTSYSKEIATELGGELITFDEIPDGIVPIKFDSVQSAKDYLANEEQLAEEIYNVTETTGSNFFTDASTGVKTQTFYTGVGNVNVYAKYSYSKGKFTRVNSVTSSFTGVTIGNEWVQDTYSSSISNHGKKLTVTIYGHFDHYILVNTRLTKVGSEKKSYKATWSY